MSLENERSGRPSTSKTTENIGKNPEIIDEECRRTIYELGDAD
jgi:hypothetical protein